MKNRYVRIVALNLLQFALLVLLFVGIGAKEFVDPTSNNLYMFALAAGAGSVPAILLTLLFYKYVDNQPLRGLRFGFNRKHVIFSVVSSAFIVGAYLVYCWALSVGGMIDVSLNRNFFANAHAVPMFLSVGFAWFLAAFNEELLDRAYFVANFKHLSPIKLYVYSSILFMILHAFKGLDPFYTTFLLLMGMTFMYVFIKTGSVLAASIPHAAYNFITAQPVGNTDISVLNITSGQIGDLQIGVYSLLVMAGLIVLSQLFYRRSMTKCLTRFNETM
ncbi:CPBP family intramembrane glutamic endopeptidase [Paenibacillus thermotolerans]|uniref:CPBP family intramembrane glutamic endopeptidase n=1 Tax=Paenibacillus thermotolerans TaxID=3027807 RepID=UPI0023683FFB|nr:MULTISPECIES: CPBP family intramembrane glutamic endopeptidase [unclassified Paenibacillus]